MLIIPIELQEEIVAHGISSYPNEGCGLLFGRVEQADNIVTAIEVMDNVWPVEEEKPERFKISEEAWLAAEFKAMRTGFDIVGIFHSHPNHPPIASPRDLAWASWAGYSYLITEIRDGEPKKSRSWQLNNDRTDFMEETILLM